MSEIIKVIDKKETQTNKKKKTKAGKNERDKSYSETVRAKWFCCAFKSVFLQLICKAPSIFKPNLELALSVISNEREAYESKHVAVDCRCLKI